MKLICISASNIAHQKSEDSTSYKICQNIADAVGKKINGVAGTIIELKNKAIHPCIGCGKCFDSHRCAQQDDFNQIYAEIIQADMVFIVSPHYAPIPAKLAALLEKMEQITFLHWGKDNSYKSEMFGKPVGIISHGGGGKWALKSYKTMVNDTIANALDTIQLKAIAFNNEWNTGISLPVKNVTFCDGSIFPIQEYDWDFIAKEISVYVDRVIMEVDDGRKNL
jgi:multimeric flavodoxin WrbA